MLDRQAVDQEGRQGGQEGPLSRCCAGRLSAASVTARVSVSRCIKCGSLHAVHLKASQGTDYWKMASLTEQFQFALQSRRMKQAAQIERAFAPELRKGAVLDYGCGYGNFVQHLISKGIDAYGCDLSVADTIRQLPSERFLPIADSWEVPQRNFALVTLLDVLEHTDDPAAFLGELSRAAGKPMLLIKVPNARGPIGSLATIAARLGQRWLLERMLLVGDVSPHRFYFTADGLRSLLRKSGYREKATLSIADVGAEMPGRFRPTASGSGSFGSSLLQLPMSGLGATLEAISSFWSDSIIILFEPSD